MATRSKPRPSVDRRPISRFLDRGTQRIGCLPHFLAIKARKAAPAAGARAALFIAPIFSTGSGGFRMTMKRALCE